MHPAATDPSARLTRTLLIVVLVAAIVTAPVFLFAEACDRVHIQRVIGSNGAAAVLCTLLLLLLRSGRVELVARVLVFGLLSLVIALAATSGEDVHVNVVNFVLVSVIGSVLLGRRGLALVGTVSALVMCAIACRQADVGPEAGEWRFASIAQFLPSYLVILLVLWAADPSARFRRVPE